MINQAKNFLKISKNSQNSMLDGYNTIEEFLNSIYTYPRKADILTKLYTFVEPLLERATIFLKMTQFQFGNTPDAIHKIIRNIQLRNNECDDEMKYDIFTLIDNINLNVKYLEKIKKLIINELMYLQHR